MVRTSECQLDIGSSVKDDSPKFFLASYQRAVRSRVAKKANNISVFNHVDVKKCFVEMDGIRYRKVAVNIIHATNDYLNQNRDINFFHEIFAKEP